MTTDLEKQFFDTFGISPKSRFRGCKLGAKYYAEICDEQTCIGCDEEIRKTEYPQITDRILLELICINNFYTYFNYSKLASLSFEHLKKEILKELLYTTELCNFEELKHQVQTLFKEG